MGGGYYYKKDPLTSFLNYCTESVNQLHRKCRFTAQIGLHIYTNTYTWGAFSVIYIVIIYCKY